MTNLNMQNNSCSMKYALKSVPGVADVGVSHGDDDGPVTRPKGPDQKFNRATLTSIKNWSGWM